MRNWFLVLAASMMLGGCVTERELPGREPYWKTAETVQSLSLVTPAMVQECSAQVAKLFGYPIKFVGPFAINPVAAFRGADKKLTLFGPDHTAENTVAVVAPINSTNIFGGESKLMAGCLYRLRDNRLVFEKAKTFGRRIDIHVDPEKTKRAQAEREASQK
jgi:hypothetical protein